MQKRLGFTDECEEGTNDKRATNQDMLDTSNIMF